MSSKRLRIFTFIDAFGWKLAQRAPFLDDVLTCREPLTSIFGYSSTCDPTILTGLMPQDHGHFSCFYYNPEGSPFRLCRWLNLLPQSITRRGRVRRYLSLALKRYYGYTGYFQIYNMPFRLLPYFDYSEKRDLYHPRGILSGAETIFDFLRAEGIPYSLSDWRRTEAQNLDALHAAIDAGEVRFAYLYLATMDAVLHQYGPDSAEALQHMERYARDLRAIWEHARTRYDDVQLCVFSDHGMTAVTDHVDLIGPIGALGLEYGKDYAAVYDSTMARFWFFNDRARTRIRETLAAMPKGRLLTDADLAGYGCLFPDRKYGEVFWMADPGVLVCPSFMGETMLAGMHGYEPAHPDSQSVFLSSFRPDPMPHRLDDLYRLMRREAEGLR